MYTTYKGYFQNGRFISPELAVIPDNIEVHVTIIEEKTDSVKTKAQLQNEALKQLSAGLKAIDDEPFDDEFDAIMSRRFNIGRELDL